MTPTRSFPLFTRTLLTLVVALVVPVAGQTGVTRPLSPQHVGIARTAWSYFERNYRPNTGLVDSVEGFPSTTMWDTASALGATVASRELGLIESAEFDRRITALLQTLNTMSLAQDELPNKVYHTETLTKVDYSNVPGETGWSALDLGRLLVWLRITKERYPQHADAIDRAVLRWRFCRVLDACGTMYGAAIRPDRSIAQVQEGRLGYEEYAAKGFALWGFGTARAARPEPYETTMIFGVPVPHDARDSKSRGVHNAMASEAYLLQGLEMNFDLPEDRVSDDRTSTDAQARDFAERVFDVQERRFARTGALTARTEHHTDRPPYFVYDTVFADGRAWNTIGDDGRFRPEFAAVATKAAIGLWALSDSPYNTRLFEAVMHLAEPGRGFYEGLYENGTGPIRTFTANTNGVILAALLYKSEGKLLKFRATQPGLWERAIEAANGRRACLPSSRQRPECGR